MTMKYKRTVGGTAFTVFNYIFLLLITFLCIYPFYYIVINTISNNEMSAAGEIMFIPRQLHFTNYIRVMGLPGLSRSAFISVSRTVIGTCATVVVAGFVGFMFTKPMWMRKFWYRFVISSMYFSAGLIPYFLTVSRLGLRNNFLVYILPLVVQPFSILLVKTFVESTPPSLQESAEIDGASTLTIFWKIVFPLIKPVLATVAIFAAVGQWNMFMDTLLFITNQDLHTLQFTLYTYISRAGLLARLVQAAQLDAPGLAAVANMQTDTSVRMTVTVLVTLPILFVYPFFQKYFVKGIMIGAVKG